MKALQKSTTIHATMKQKVEKVLIADYMSSEESIVQDIKAVVRVKVRHLNQRRDVNDSLDIH